MERIIVMVRALVVLLLALAFSFPPVSGKHRKAGGACPSSPTSGCDFYFTGYKTSVPTFPLPTGSSDAAISPALIVSSLNSSVSVYPNTNSVIFLGVAMASPATAIPGVSNSLYTTQGKVFVRNLAQKTVRDYLAGKCVKLVFSSVQLFKAGSPTVNLNGDAVNGYPFAGRCILLKIAKK